MAEPLNERALLAKIRSLPPKRLAQVEDFVDFLREREADRQVTTATTAVSEEAFRKVWENPEDAVYDSLAGSKTATELENQRKTFEKLTQRYSPEEAEAALREVLAARE